MGVSEGYRVAQLAILVQLAFAQLIEYFSREICHYRYRSSSEVTIVQSTSHGELSRPLSGSCLILWLVRLVDLSNLWHKRIIWIRVSQQRTDREENFGDGQRWRPILFQDVLTDRSIGVDVWMIDSGSKIDLGWLEGIVRWEMNVQEEYTTGIWGIFWSHDRCLPVILILLINWSSRTIVGWILSKINELFLDSFDC